MNHVIKPLSSADIVLFRRKEANFAISGNKPFDNKGFFTSFDA